MDSFKTHLIENPVSGGSKPKIRTIRMRLRRVNGKITVQRRKKVSGVSGYTLRGGTLRRISPQERLHRRIGARKAKIKRRAKAQRIALRRKITMNRRHSMGLP